MSVGRWESVTTTVQKEQLHWLWTTKWAQKEEEIIQEALDYLHNIIIHSYDGIP